MAVVMEIDERVLAAKFEVILPHLDERQRRLLLAAEARSLGYGGVSLVAILWGKDAQSLAPLLEDVPKIDSRIRARTRPTAAPSARTSSAARTNCWRNRAASPSTGPSPNGANVQRGKVREDAEREAPPDPE